MTDEQSSNNVTQSNNKAEGDIAGRDVTKITNYHMGEVPFKGTSQLEKLYLRLQEERQNSVIFDEIIEELLHFKQYAPNTEVIGLEQKLERGNRNNYIYFAMQAKEKFAKKLLKNEYSETSQMIYAFLLAKVYSNFQNHISPRIKEDLPEEFITGLINQHIVNPLEDLLGDNLLRIYEDEINGMIYFLTGNCHINWD